MTELVRTSMLENNGYAPRAITLAEAQGALAPDGYKKLPAGIEALDECTMAMLVPGTGLPRVPDINTTFSTSKWLQVATSVRIEGSDTLVIMDGQTNQNRIGEVFQLLPDKPGSALTRWQLTDTISVAGDVTQFLKARSVAGRVTIVSNTRSTDKTVLDGTITTISGPAFPAEFSATQLPSYVAHDKLAKVGTPLPEGHTILFKPTYNGFESKLTGSYKVNFDKSREPDLCFSQTVTGHVEEPGELWRFSEISRFANRGSIYVEVNTDESDPLTENTLWVGEAACYGEDFVIGETKRQSSAQFGSNGMTAVFDPSSASSCWYGWKVVNKGAPAKPVEYTIRLWFMDPLYARQSNHYKTVSYIAGSTGEKSVNINGVVGYEFVPRPQNLMQITMSPPLGITNVPLEVSNGLLANCESMYRLVYSNQEYYHFVTKFISGAVDHQTLLLQAVNGVGSASILSSIASFFGRIVKPVVSGLKAVGIHPGELIKKGVDYAISNGYAASVPGPGGFQGPGIGRASTKGGTSNVSLGIEGDLDFDGDENPNVQAAIAPKTAAQLQVEDIITSLPFQSKYSGAAISQFRNAHRFRRYAGFVVVSLEAKAAGTAIFEWGVGKREGHDYLMGTQVVRRCAEIFHMDVPQVPSWFNNVALDSVFVQNIVEDQDSFRALMAWVLTPQMISVTIPVVDRDQVVLHVTLHLPSGIQRIIGYSWWGALMQLVIGKDPSLIVEIGSRYFSQFGCPTVAVSPVDAFEEKLAHVIAMRDLADPGDVLSRALRSCGVPMKLCWFADTSIAPALKANSKTLKGAIASDLEVARGQYGNGVVLILTAAFWERVLAARCQQLADYMTAVSHALGKLKLVVEADGTAVLKNVSSDSDGTQLAPPEFTPDELFNQVKKEAGSSWFNYVGRYFAEHDQPPKVDIIYDASGTIRQVPVRQVHNLENAARYIWQQLASETTKSSETEMKYITVPAAGGVQVQVPQHKVEKVAPRVKILDNAKELTDLLRSPI